jgi:hypothetical protein
VPMFSNFSTEQNGIAAATRLVFKRRYALTPVIVAGFSWLSSVLEGKCWHRIFIRPRPPLSKSFLILIERFDNTVQCDSNVYLYECLYMFRSVITIFRRHPKLNGASNSPKFIYSEFIHECDLDLIASFLNILTSSHSQLHICSCFVLNSGDEISTST